jgi:hypothetical protein
MFADMDYTATTQENHGFFAVSSANDTEKENAIASQVAKFSAVHRLGVLDMILDMGVADWLSPYGLPFVATFRHDPIQWPRILATARTQYQGRADLEMAVDAYLIAHPELCGLEQNPVPAGEPKAHKRLKIINAEDLRRMVIPPLRWIINGLLPAGCTIVAGPPKDGKSLLAWNLSVAAATGGIALGRERVQQGSVLYLALEEGERRAQERLNMQMEQFQSQADLSLLDIVLWEAPRIGDGLEEELTSWIDRHQDARLIIIDILEKVRPQPSRNGNIYSDGYGATAPLTRIAQERNIALMVVHHSNKTRPEDIRDSVSGPASLLGGADTFWGLRRGVGTIDATLSITGRDVPEQELALQFQAGFWTVLGGAEEYRLSQGRKEVLEYLTHVEEPQTPKQIALALAKPEPSMRVRLQRMADQKQVLNYGGRYVIHPSYNTFCTDDDEGDEVSGGGSLGSPGSAGSHGSPRSLPPTEIQSYRQDPNL